MAMDRTRVAKVDDVTLARRGEQVNGTLHLTPHHLIFVHTPLPPKTTSTAPSAPKPRELWITYPIISLCTLRTAPAASRQPSSIRLRCRDFTFICFYFKDDVRARDVYDSIRAWTCKLGRIEKLYAFTYQPQGPEKGVNFWGIYDHMKEYRRMGVTDEPGGKWRISRINKDYSFSPTYPALLPVPAAISDNTLNYAGRYRSRARIPVLTYLHPVNSCSVTRCSQPLVGVRQNRSIQDEKLLSAIFSTTRNERPLSQAMSPPPEREDSGSSRDTDGAQLDGDLSRTSTEALEDAIISELRGDDLDGDEEDGKKPLIYGAQQRNMIVDARPTVNAYAMQAVGLGSENMDNYKFATKVYLGIDNIHVMRESLNKVIDALKDSDVTPLGPNRELLQKSHWLKHIANMLDGVGLIARQVGLQHSHVLIHCSDGWDRTSQLSSLSQICLDPYYRTIEGFIVLIEKDWLSFGHMFRHRSGFLSSEKWFQIENERVSRDTDPEKAAGKGGDAIAGAQKTFENALLSAKGFFSTKHQNESRESLNIDSEAEQIDSDSPSTSRRAVSGSGTTPSKDKNKGNETKVKETAPIFHQFLDATFQLLYQHPTRFEYNSRFLRRLLYHLYSCQYGTFLFDNERSRVEARVQEKTRCVWDYFLSRKEMFVNPEWDQGEIDDNVRGKERLIFPRIDETGTMGSSIGSVDSDPSSIPATQQQDPSTRASVLIGVETTQDKVGVAAGNNHGLKTVQSESALSNGYADHESSVPSSSAEVVDRELHPQKSSISLQNNLAATVVEAQGDPDHFSSRHRIHHDSGDSDNGDDHPEPPAAITVSEDPLDNLADDLDPLGIAEAKDRIPISKTRVREQMEILMQ